MGRNKHDLLWILVGIDSKISNSRKTANCEASEEKVYFCEKYKSNWKQEFSNSCNSIAK